MQWRILILALAVMAFPGLAVMARAGEAWPEIPVAAATIYPGEVITRGMLRMRPVPKGYFARGGFVADAGRIIGKMARRTLVRGRAIAANALREPFAVRSGKAVRVVYRARGVVISALGTALQSASDGEPVAVRNVDSGRIVHGVAHKGGVVVVSRR